MPTDQPRRGKVTSENRLESQALKAIWDSDRGRAARRQAGAVTQEAFGVEFSIGNQAAVGFFLNGKTALSLKAAIGFARGLNCRVSEFSPRLAALIESSPSRTAVNEPAPTYKPAQLVGAQLPADIVLALQSSNSERVSAFYQMARLFLQIPPAESSGESLPDLPQDNAAKLNAA
jgi:hypothetical protein